MRKLTSLADALQFGLECEATGRHAQAEALYRRLLRLGVSGTIDGRPAVLPVYEALVRSAALANESMDAAVDAFEEMLRIAGSPVDTAFQAIYLRGLRRTGSYPLPLPRMARQQELAVLLQQSARAGGDVVECGCFRGLSSYVIASYLKVENPDFTGAGMHVFDSFAGLSKPGAEDTVGADEEEAEAERLRRMCRPGHFRASLEEVKASLAEFPDIEFHRGWIPQSFADQPERRYRFVHVDVDLYAPTLACFEYFWPRLAADGIMVCDDFGWPGGRLAVERFSSTHGLGFTSNSHKQAVMRKPPAR